MQKVGEIVASNAWHKNNKSFNSVCQGVYGRKVIYTNKSEVNVDNVLEVFEKALKTHNQNRREIDYLYHYVAGDQPILYRTKDVRPEIQNNVVENHAWEITRFNIAQTFGEPVQYVSMKGKEGLSEEIDKLNDYMRDINKHYYDVILGDWRSTCGIAYRETWSLSRDEMEDDGPAMAIDSPDPRDNFIVYYSGRGNKPLASFSRCYNEDDEEYWLCTTPRRTFEIKDDKVISDNFNGHGRLLLVEYPNNVRRLSDVEIVITMLDGINKIQSNRLDGIEQFVQSFIKFVNCEIDEATFLKMCKIGALKVKTVNPSMPADVNMISSELNQQQTQVAKDDLYKNVLIVEGMPSREQNTGGDTGQAVYLRNGWDFAEQRANLDEPVIIKSEKDFLRIALNILKTKQQISSELKVSDIDVKITRNNTDNMMVKAQALIYLLQNGIHPKIAIRTVGLWSDPEKVFVESQPYLEAKFDETEGMKKKLDVFVQCLNAGFSVSDAGIKAGIEVSETNNPNFAKWNYEEESGDE